MSLPPPPAPRPPPPRLPPPSMVAKAPAEAPKQLDDTAPGSLAEARARLLGKTTESKAPAAAPEPQKLPKLPPPAPPAPKTQQSPLAANTGQQGPSPTSAAPKEAAAPKNSDKTTGSKNEEPKPKTVAGKAKVDEPAGAPNGTFERPALRSAAKGTLPAGSHTADKPKPAEMKATERPVVNPLKGSPVAEGPSPKSSQPSPASPVVGTGAGAAAQQVASLVHQEETARTSVYQEERDDFFMLHYASHARQAVIREQRDMKRAAATQFRYEGSQLALQETLDREQLNAFEGAVRWNVQVIASCEAEIKRTATQQRQAVCEAVRTAIAGFEKDTSRRTPEGVLEAVTEKLRDVECCLRSAIDDSGIGVQDPRDWLMVRLRPLYKEERDQRDFIEDLQLSVRREIVGMCYAVMLAPFRLDSCGSHRRLQRNHPRKGDQLRWREA